MWQQAPAHSSQLREACVGSCCEVKVLGVTPCCALRVQQLRALAQLGAGRGWHGSNSTTAFWSSPHWSAGGKQVVDGTAAADPSLQHGFHLMGALVWACRRWHESSNITAALTSSSTDQGLVLRMYWVPWQLQYISSSVSSTFCSTCVWHVVGGMAAAAVQRHCGQHLIGVSVQGM